MPGVVRKLVILAAADGLILQPLQQQPSRAGGVGGAAAAGQYGKHRGTGVKIEYRSGRIGSLGGGGGGGGGEEEMGSSTVGGGFEAFGIVGLLSVSPTTSYLISITRREQVAQIEGRAVYVITEVALTPLSSHKEATASVAQTAATLQRRADGAASESDSESDVDEVAATAAGDDDVDDVEIVSKAMAERPALHERKSSIAEDVMARKGGYGRFAQKWFSKNGWTADRRRGLGLSVSDVDTTERPRTGQSNVEAVSEASGMPAVKSNIEEAGPNVEARDVAASLLPKLLRTTSLLFGSSRSFFYSYDYDITKNFANRNLDSTGSDRPLYREVDPLFFWNRNVIQPFIDAGQSSLVLPLLQGFVGQREFTVDTQTAEVRGPNGETSMEMTEITPKEDEQAQQAAKLEDAQDDATRSFPSTDDGASQAHIADNSRTFLMTLISRRSVKRAGLRYLRRGVDEDGNAANYVETEQILSSPEWSPTRSTYSFLQVRGSIPIFFSQSPYSFKPVPQLLQSPDHNFRALRKHFAALAARYRGVQVVSLVEKHGNERIVGDAYDRHLRQLDAEGGIHGARIAFEWFDFHAICRGMRFENVALLLDTLAPTLDAFGYTVEHGGRRARTQCGVLRTNCMDCLDRTNVVQSACGRRALEMQLRAEGFDVAAQRDQNTLWFNILWADNGDAISKQYASTAALKGDFTRTRKRDYKGALTDMGLSISRFYSGIVNDYFSQAAIDFLVGNVTSLVFSDFEDSMDAPDPAISTSRMRQQAIDASQRLVIADETEELVGGWALLSPHEPNTIKSMPFEESVLLLTNAALYACRFDWNMEKVSSFERVDLRHIIGVKYGTYVINTLSAAQADERRNVGLVVTYTAATDTLQRVNTRSMSTAAPATRQDGDLLQGTSTTVASPAPTPLMSLLGGHSTSSTRVLALKALPARTAVAKVDADSEGGLMDPKMSEMDLVQMICAEIERSVRAVRAAGDASVEKQNDGRAKEEEEDILVQRDNIISLAEARRSTGLLEQLGHSLKKLVWA
ncbi:MAG: hypothetical protein M1818_004193 [Claussenomyces sp. TS43310]|nr:MAG: hypothetical protein M1818_004193 [Claussenomyces sp. TS43310]